MVKARSGAGGRPVGQLPPQPWLTHPATRRVIAALTAEGGEVRFVGGCVRDALLQRSVNDIDLATPERPELVLARLAQASLRALPTGLAHGTVTALVDGQTFEITTLRRDVACDGRRAVVAYTDNWAEDAARRDFTINALSADPAGSVYDPFDGLPDLHHGRVRFVGSPRTRIEEDVLRLLRYFRFHGWYGRPPPDREALAACRALAPRLATLSAERVRDELWKILLVPDPASMLLLMQGERVLAHVLPEAGAFGCLRLLAWFEGHGLRVEGTSTSVEARDRSPAWPSRDPTGSDPHTRHGNACPAAGLAESGCQAVPRRGSAALGGPSGGHGPNGRGSRRERSLVAPLGDCRHMEDGAVSDQRKGCAGAWGRTGAAGRRTADGFTPMVGGNGVSG
ncbi:MAG: poly(A) polymerase [Rhodospirillaceae bacterium]|nr:MAG: poly(A) polymerase [Rhodospirillaceae bacterium]